MPEPIRVLIADDHRLFTEALDAILSADRRIAVAATARFNVTGNGSTPGI